MFDSLTGFAQIGLLSLVQVLLVIGVAMGLNMLAQRHYAGRKTMQTRLQIIQAALIVFAIVTIVIIVPMGDSRRGQLLSFLGIVISAAIALSSTTVLGNAMAGLMLRSIKAFKPGDYIFIGEHAGRVTELDLLHVEIQTEDSDLATLSNIYLVNNPFRVIRSEEGTILSANVSLGYDVNCEQVKALLMEGIAEAGLENPFVHVVDLGDFSVTYRAAGQLKPAKGVIGKRSELRLATLNALHRGGVEIVSPNFMNTRALAPDARIIPAAARKKAAEAEPVSADDIVFDKAEEAESLESIRERHKAVLDRIAAASEQLKKSASSEKETAALTGQIEQDTRKAELLAGLILKREEKLSKD